MRTCALVGSVCTKIGMIQRLARFLHRDDRFMKRSIFFFNANESSTETTSQKCIGGILCVRVEFVFEAFSFCGTRLENEINM